MSEPLLSIVMPALLQRLPDNTMLAQISEQIEGLGTRVEFFCLLDNGPMSTGAKLQAMFDMCSGKYICLVADDDRIEDDYINTLLDVIEDHDVDVITFDHTYNIDGCLVSITKQIMKCQEKEHGACNGVEEHHRLPGPLCPVRADIAKRCVHPDMSDKEDLAYKHFVRDNTETFYNIPRVLYHHMWNSNNKKERVVLKELWKRQ